MPNFPVSPVISGLVNAMSIANMMHRAQLEDQQLQMAKARFADEQQARDIDIRQMLNTSGRPIVGGAIAEQAQDEVVPGVKRDFTILRPPDKGRTVNYKSPSGEQLAYELKTPEEQRAAQLKAKLAEAQAMGDMNVANQGRIAKAKLDAEGLMIPPAIATELGYPAGAKVMPQNVDDLMRAYATAQTAKRPKIVGHGVIPGRDDQYVYSINDQGTVTQTGMNIGPRPFAPQRTPIATPNQTRLEENDKIARQITGAASMAMFGAKDAESARAKLDQMRGKSEFVQTNYSKILKEINGSFGSSGKKTADTPEAIANQINTALGNQGNGAGPKATKGKANGDQVRAYAKKLGISFKAAVGKVKAEGFDVTGLE